MLDTIPLVFVLAGLVFYTVLAGADFGAGVWQLLARVASGATPSVTWPTTRWVRSGRPITCG